MRDKKKAKLVVRLVYDYGGGYERYPAGGRKEIDAIETIFSALNWVEMENLEKALGVLLNSAGLMRLGRHEGRARRNA